MESERRRIKPPSAWSTHLGTAGVFLALILNIILIANYAGNFTHKLDQSTEATRQNCQLIRGALILAIVESTPNNPSPSEQRVLGSIQNEFRNIKCI